MEISQWVPASGWILENYQQNHITVLLPVFKKQNKAKVHTTPSRWHIRKFCFLKKKKVCSLLRWTLVLEGYWIFLFPGKTAKFFTTSKVKKVPFYTWSLKAYLSLAAEWFADSIWTEHPQPRAAKAEQSFCRILSHQLLRVTCNTGRVSCRHSIWSLLPKKGSYLT